MQKPVPLGEKQRTRFAIKWMLAAAEHRKGRTIEERLAREALAIIKGKPEDIRGKPEDNKGKPEDKGKPDDNNGWQEVLKKKHDVHRLGMVNRCVFHAFLWLDEPELNGASECQRKCSITVLRERPISTIGFCCNAGVSRPLLRLVENVAYQTW